MVLADRIRLANTRQLLRAFGGLNETYGLSLIHISANADAALAALEMMDFEGVEKVRARVRQNGTLVLGAHAYGVTELEGGGREHIVKQLGYGDDPLNQRASVGWKGMRAAERLGTAGMEL